MCPALPDRLKAKPFKPQKELKHQRKRKTLRRYAKRRRQYLSMKLLCMCVAALYYLPEINAWRKEQRTIGARPGNNRRQCVHRARVKLLKKQARLQEKLEAVAAKMKTAEARIAKREADLRKHATAQEGFRQGWCAAVPMDEAEMMAQSYAKRFIVRYLEAAAERKRVEGLMETQQSKPVAQPATIKL
jgi:hypothetical protein